MRVSGTNKINSKIKSSTDSKFCAGLTREEGTYCELLENEQLTLTLNNLSDNLYLFPYLTVENGGICTIYNNYRSLPALQSCRYSDEELSSTDIENFSKRLEINSNRTTYRVNKDYLILTKSGINQIYIKNTGNGKVKFHGFYVMGTEEFKLHKKLNDRLIAKSGSVNTQATTGRVDFDESFNTLIGISVVVDEYQKTDGVVSIYNQGNDGFNYNVNTSGVNFRWFAIGK